MRTKDLINQNKEPTVSIVILNFNGESYLENCLSSVLNTDYPSFEVILFDNASTDQSLVLARERFGSDERLKIVRAEKNLGFASGNNAALKHTRGKYVIFLNNDTIVDTGWVSALVEVLEKDSTIGIAQSLIFEISGEKIAPSGAGWLVDPYLALRKPLGPYEPDEYIFPAVFETSFAVGAAMAARREFLNKIGLFDPKFPFFYDDIFLSLKTWLANKRVVTVSKSKVNHIESATFKRSGWRMHKMYSQIFRGLITLLLNMHADTKDFPKAFFIFSFSVLLRDSGLAKGKNVNINFVSAYACACVWILANLKYIWRRRLEVWNTAEIAPETLIHRFTKIKIPDRFYFLKDFYYKSEVQEYENSLIKKVSGPVKKE